MHKNRTKMVFITVKQRDKQLKAFTEGSYSIDSKNPLIIWLK